MVNASIITIGDELLIGQTVDTNSAYIAQELNKIGIWVKRRVAVGDVKEEILAALKEQSKDCQVIIITGGLGPTADDITKPTLCEYFNSKLIVDEGVLQNLKDIFTKLNRPHIERNLKQAEVPDNCVVLPNLRGTAPGMWWSIPAPAGEAANDKTSLHSEGHIYISLPGVPNEMKGLIQHSVIPKLKGCLQLPTIVHYTAVTSGMGESFIADILVDFEANLPAHIKLAYLPAYGMVRLRLTGRGSSLISLKTEVKEQFQKLKLLVKEWIVAEEDISLAKAVNNVLKETGRTLATAESCTGGYIAHLITSEAGSSAVYKGSIISYANEVKENILHVQSQTLQQHGAVSEQTVTEMVKGVLKVLNTDYAIATSGIMGPDGGSPEKPVGTVWIAVGNNEKVKTSKHFFRFDRERNIELAAQTALTLLRKFIIENEHME